MKPQLTVVKLGGNIIDDELGLSNFLETFAALKGNKILVHGGGKVATSIGKRLGIEPVILDGRRITDQETLNSVTMVYAGLLNKTIVAKLQSLQCNAFGLCGADGNLIQSNQREASPIDYGFVGDPIGVNAPLVESLFANALVPVIAPITHNGKGQLLNTNADTVASSLASALSKNYDVHLLFAFEKNGVLLDIDNEKSAMKLLSQKEVSRMKQSNSIHSGMIPKLAAGFSALESGVTQVSIGNAFHLPEIISGNYIATQLCL